MHGSSADIAALQGLLDRSYEAAGPHLLRIHTPERRLGIDAARMFTFSMPSAAFSNRLAYAGLAVGAIGVVVGVLIAILA